MGGAGAVSRGFESAEDRYPDKMVYIWHSAFERWFVVARDDPMKRIVPADCAREWTSFQAPTFRPTGCPDIPTKTTLDLGTLQEFRHKDDRREWLKDPELWDLAELASDASVRNGSRRDLFADADRLLDDPLGVPDLVKNPLLDLMRELFGAEAAAALARRDKEATQKMMLFIPDRPLTATEAAAVLDQVEAIYTARTGEPAPPTPQLRDPGHGPGHFRLPGFNPTYPTTRGLRDQSEERRRFAYLYGKARGLWYECGELTFWQDIRQRIPEGFRRLYALHLAGAEELLDDIRAAKRARFEERDYDLRTCRPKTPAPPPPPPGAPPPDHGEVASYIYSCAYQIIADVPYAGPGQCQGSSAACAACGGIWIRSPVFVDGFIGHWEYAPAGSGPQG